MTITSEILRRTPLYALHLELGGKMVPFAGYEMPVQYPAGILKEHLHTREKAGLFDVSHMGQAFLAGDTAALERVTPADVTGLKEGMQRYGLLLTDAGTIKDDFMFSRLAGEKDLYLVVNAGTKEGDFAYIAEKLKGAATLTPRSDRALLALQGPAAAARAGKIVARHLRTDLHAGAPRHGCRRARHRQPHRLYRRGRFRDFAGRRRCRESGARAAGRSRCAADRSWRAR